MTQSYLAELGYIGFEVSDLAAWTVYAQTVLGLEVNPGPSAGSRLLVMDDHGYRIILVEGPSDDIAFAGWRAASAQSFDDFIVHLTAHSVAFSPASPDALALRGVDRMVHFRDPDGNRHEAYWGQTRVTSAVSTDRVPGGFVTGNGGLGHVVYGSSDHRAAIAFAQDILGLGLSDTIQQAIGGGRVLDVAFLHINERHHSLAYSDFRGAKSLHHFMLEVARIENVGLARDRQLKAGLPVAMDIGQHPNDQMISFYGETPSGFLIEYGWGGAKVDPSAWTVGNYDRISDWGHRPLPASARPSA